MKLTFYGGAKMVTGSNYLLEHEGTQILIDCGLHQGSHFCERHNWEPFPYDPARVAAVFITHAHIDHVGRLPTLVRDGFKGTVYSTAPTRDIAHTSLADSDHILAQEAERFNMPLLYEAHDIDVLMSRWKSVAYHETVTVGPFRVTLWNAAHILGSAFIVVEAGGKRMVFSGDLGNAPAPLIGSWEEPPDVDYALIESTYGGRIHEALPERKELLAKFITETVKRNGVLLIPSFAVERTQELLFELHDLQEHKQIPKVPVFLDSPLAIKMTDIYKRYTTYLTPEARRREPGEKHPLFEFPGLHRTMTTQESKAINDVSGPKVIIAGSGMSHGGRILHHEKRYLPGADNMLLIVGYQAHGSLGRTILDGAKTITMFGTEVLVRAHIKAIGGYSAHADQPQLLQWLTPLAGKVKRVFIAQGEVNEAMALKEKITTELHMDAHIPDEKEEVML